MRCHIREFLKNIYPCCIEVDPLLLLMAEWNEAIKCESVGVRRTRNRMKGNQYTFIDVTFLCLNMNVMSQETYPLGGQCLNYLSQYSPIHRSSLWHTDLTRRLLVRHRRRMEHTSGHDLGNQHPPDLIRIVRA